MTFSVALEIKIDSVTNEGIAITIPLYRVDVTRPADVIEEILRIYGYDNIEMPKKFNSNSYDYESNKIYRKYSVKIENIIKTTLKFGGIK